MKHRLFFLIALVTALALPQVAQAYDFSYTYQGKTLNYTIIGNYGVEVSGYSSYPLGDVVIPDSVENGSIKYAVTFIGNNAFHGCSSLTSVSIPEGVISIGSQAFDGCTGLTSVTIPNSVTSISFRAFSDCSGLTSVSIGSGVTYIANYAFENCSSLTSVTIPDNVSHIEYSAFLRCTGLITATIGSGVTSIGSDAFGYCSSLTSITIGSGVTSIGSDAFSHCSSLTSITIPNSVTSIGNGAFYYCTSLTSAIIGDSVTSIGSYAFGFCSSLTSITIPNSVDSIYQGAFSCCTNLDTIFMMPFTPPTLGSSVFIVNASGRVFILNGCSYDNYYNNSTWNTYRNYLRHPIINFNFTLSVNDSTYGAANIIPGPGNRDIRCDSTIVVEATANYGYHFDHWSNGSTLNPDTITLLGNSSSMAFFVPNQYTLTVNADEHGTVTGNGAYNYLSNRTITATANYGYHFTQWNDGITDNPRTITLTQDTSFTAFFGINSYTVSVQSSDTIRGTVTGGVTTEYLNTTTISATANYGYHFSHWNDGNTDNPRTVQVTDNATYTAYFDYDQFSLTVQSDNTAQGNVSGGGNYNYLSNRTITATPNYGYHFTQWDDGNTDNPRSITLTQDTAFTAFFENNSYTILVVSNDTVKGIALGSTTTLYLDSITISAAANNGYHFTHWNGGVTDNPRTVQVTGNTTYTAYFDYDQFTLTVQSDNTAQGNVSGGGSYNYLSNRTITATPTYGHHFTYWNDGVTENPRTITLTQDTTFTAHFAPNQYTLTVNAGEHGTATGSGTYNFGDTITIQAFPDDHYHFTRWNDGNTENPRQYRIEDNITLTAFFVIDTYTVSVVSSDIIRGMVEASGTEFVYGTPCTVTATAYTGYTFAGWSNGITANPYTFAVISDVELTALFVEEGEEVYTVTVESADPTMGTVSGGGQALSGGTLTIRAIPNDGYRFRCWNDGNTENPRTVTVTGNITYTAYFESTQGIGDIDATEIKIYTTGGRIVVQGAEGMEKRVYDLMGREVVRFNQNGETPVLPSGVYLVKVGTLPARKVVVMR